MSRLTEQAWRADEDELLAMAARLHSASKMRDATVNLRDESADRYRAWQEATHEWRQARDAMYEADFSHGFDPHIAAIRAGQPDAVETAIRFLDIDPWCFRSGWAKERLLRALKSVRLDADQIRRLRSTMMRAVDDRDRQELAEWCRLAANLDLAAVRVGLRKRLGSDDEHVRRRAAWSLARIEEYQRTQVAHHGP